MTELISSSLAQSGSGSTFRTTATGTVVSRATSENRNGGNNVLDAIQEKKERSDKRRKPEIIDARNLVNRAEAIGIKGDCIMSIQRLYEADFDEQNSTTEQYLKRLQERSADNNFATNRSNDPPSFPQGEVQELSTGARRLDSPLLRGTGFGSSGAGGRAKSGSVAASVATIALPTPDNLQENMNIAYESKDQGGGNAIMNTILNSVGAALGIMPAGEDGVIQTLNSRFKEIKNFYSDPTKTANLFAAFTNMQGITSFNKAFNNSQVQQFAGVSPRTFNFSWKLYADSEAGTRSIFRVIQLLKENSHPELIDPYMNIVRYPAVFPRFDVRAPNGLIIFPVFESVITDVTVDYSASGSPFFFKSGAPTSIALSLTLMEITSRVREDYRRRRSGFA
jgi:hypothetical protein